MTKTIVTLGELMMRLKPPGKLRLRQANSFEVCHGGAEANVAVSLAEFGVHSRFVTALPRGELGAQALRFLRAHGIDTTSILLHPGRLGLYFMEEGADFRSGCVVYDRADSVFAHMSPDEIDWDAAFRGADWFHISGITPALSEASRQLAAISMQEARRRNVHVSLDLNYRERLSWPHWQILSSRVVVTARIVLVSMAMARTEVPNGLNRSPKSCLRIFPIFQMLRSRFATHNRQSDTAGVLTCEHVTAAMSRAAMK